MAAAAFKQVCPSCDALVPIKDLKLVGKKVDCPKCKYRFVVEDPNQGGDSEDQAGVDADAEAAIYEFLKANKPSKAKMGKLESGGTPAESDEAAAETEPLSPEEEKKKKKKAKNRKLFAGLALSVVGLVILCVAAAFLMSRRGDKKSPFVARPGFQNTETTTTTKTKKDTREKIVVDPNAELPAGPELTYLLPNDPTGIKEPESVAHYFLGNILVPFREIAFAKGVFSDQQFKQKLGVNILDVDDLIRAERYTAPRWSFTVVHSRKFLDPKALESALGLEPVKDEIKKQQYFKVTRNQAWLEEFGRVSLGAPDYTRHHQPRPASEPLYLRVHDRQTLVFTGETAMKAFLEVEGRWPRIGGAAPKSDPKSETVPSYLTLRRELKSVLDGLESKSDPKDTILVSSATDLDALRGGKRDRPGPYRQLWDLTHLLPDQEGRISFMGTALVQKGDRAFTYRNEAVCPSANDARELEDALRVRGGPLMARFIDRLLKHKVDYPPPDGKDVPPDETKEMATSRIHVGSAANMVSFALDLSVAEETYRRLRNEMTTLALGVKGEIDLTGGPRRHDLAKAARLMAEKGLPERGVKPGYWPPAAFPRLSPLQSAREPAQRVSWMAGLLPHLGHTNLYQSIDFNASWRDPRNWLAARTLVPEFIDPMYPEYTRYTSRPDLPIDLAATHYVGILGVGLDAADHAAGDLKRGVFGYEQSLSLKEVMNEVQKGRGLSNTILLLQVPYDGSVGVTPWIAGGGSTARGVPEDRAINSFILTKDKFGKDIKHKGRSGTYALMADGSVRWIDGSSPDKVNNAFKAMCTVKTPLPGNLDLDKSDLAELLAAPDPEPADPKKLPAPIEKTPGKKQ